MHSSNKNNTPYPLSGGCICLDRYMNTYLHRVRRRSVTIIECLGIYMIASNPHETMCMTIVTTNLVFARVNRCWCVLKKII